MRNLYILSIMVICTFSYLIAQEETATLELDISVKNNYPAQRLVEATLTLVSECWDANLYEVDDHDITTDYSGSTVSTTSNGTIGWNICWRSSPEKFGLGRYKVTVRTEEIYSDYFYIDYRTSDLPENYSASDDIGIYYDASVGILYWDENLTNQVGYDYTLWDLSSNISHITTELEPYIPINFVVSGSSNPQLSWNHSTQNDYVTGYSIYRSIVNKSQGPGVFYKITTVSSNTTSFTDYDLAIGGSMKAYYKITAVNGDRESEFTNTLEIIASPYKSQSNNVEQHTYYLATSYPNPFNPLTKIRFSTPGGENIRIIVYDILGKEIAVLLDEIRDAGEYEIDFNAEDLTSGIYFCVMNSRDYTAVRKFILIK